MKIKKSKQNSLKITNFRDFKQVLRKKLAANAKKRPKSSTFPNLQKISEKIEKVSFNWAKLIARIYEIDPLVCECGKEMKIIAFVTHSAEIRRILGGIGWSVAIPEFTSSYDHADFDVCQLVPGTKDGFSQNETLFQVEEGPDPPFLENHCDPPHWEDNSDPPHWEN